MTKPIPASKDHRQELVLSFCEILNKFWCFLRIIDWFWNALNVYHKSEIMILFG